jgi:hypothetical protein
MATGQDVVTSALKKAGVLGVGRNASAQDNNDALADLNDMIAEWNTQRWMVWDLLVEGFVSDGRVTPYTIGPGGNFNVARRPDRLESGFLRQLVQTGLNVDTPIEIIPAGEEYDRLSLKQLTSFTPYAYLDSEWPMGNIFLYPWPNASQYQIFFRLKDVIPLVTANTDLSVIPDQYISALKFNLARRLRQAYGKGLQPDTELNNLARNSLDVVKQSNLQIPELVMPKVLTMTSSTYNILSDQWSGAN